MKKIISLILIHVLLIWTTNASNGFIWDLFTDVDTDTDWWDYNTNQQTFKWYRLDWRNVITNFWNKSIISDLDWDFLWNVYWARWLFGNEVWNLDTITDIWQQLEVWNANMSTLRFDSDNWRVYAWWTGWWWEILKMTQWWNLTVSGNIWIWDENTATKLYVKNTDGSFFNYTTSWNISVYDPEGSSWEVRLWSAWTNRPWVYSSTSLNLFSDNNNDVIFGHNNVEGMRLTIWKDLKVQWSIEENWTYLINKYLWIWSKSVDSDKLDWIDSSNFLRSDGDDTMNWNLTLWSDSNLYVNGSVKFDCPNCWSTTALNWTDDWWDLTIQWRVLSANSNIYISPSDSYNVVINNDYRAWGWGSSWEAWLIVEWRISEKWQFLDQKYELKWATPIPTLQSVTDAWNTSTRSIISDLDWDFLWNVYWARWLFGNEVWNLDTITDIWQQLEVWNANMSTLRFDSDNWRVYAWWTGWWWEILKMTQWWNLTVSGNIWIWDENTATKLYVKNTDGSFFNYTTSWNISVYDPEGSSWEVRLWSAWTNRPWVYSSTSLNLFSDNNNDVIFGHNNVEGMRLTIWKDLKVQWTISEWWTLLSSKYLTSTHTVKTNAHHDKTTSLPWSSITSQPTIPTNNTELTNGANYITDGNTGWDNTYWFITDGNTGWDNDYNFIASNSNVTIDNWTSTTVTIKADSTWMAELNLMGNSLYQSTGRLYVGQSPTIGWWIEYNGDNYPITSWAWSDFITLYRREGWINSRTAKNFYRSDDWEFKWNVNAASLSEWGVLLSNIYQTIGWGSAGTLSEVTTAWSTTTNSITVWGLTTNGNITTSDTWDIISWRHLKVKNNILIDWESIYDIFANKSLLDIDWDWVVTNWDGSMILNYFNWWGWAASTFKSSQATISNFIIWMKLSMMDGNLTFDVDWSWDANANDGVMINRWLEWYSGNDITKDIFTSKTWDEVQAYLNSTFSPWNFSQFRVNDWVISTTLDMHVWWSISEWWVLLSNIYQTIGWGSAGTLSEVTTAWSTTTNSITVWGLTTNGNITTSDTWDIISWRHLKVKNNILIDWESIYDIFANKSLLDIDWDWVVTNWDGSMILNYFNWWGWAASTFKSSQATISNFIIWMKLSMMDGNLTFDVDWSWDANANDGVMINRWLEWYSGNDITKDIFTSKTWDEVQAYLNSTFSPWNFSQFRVNDWVISTTLDMHVWWSISEWWDWIKTTCIWNCF